MPLPATIQATVSPRTIEKVGRLFNGGPLDAIRELLQNARRGGATRVDIDLLDLAGHPTLAIRDDGSGIDDPNMLVALGASQWPTGTMESEDPAGMGVFSLAGHRVEYRSWSRSEHSGWRAVIEADAWSGDRPIRVEPFDIAVGTEVLIDMPEAWERYLDHAAKAAALHYPLAVWLNGVELPRRDFLADAVRITERNGCRIGVLLNDGPVPSADNDVNFHGITIDCRLPYLSEIGVSRIWSVRVDIVDAPHLQLVLPARKEAVRNAALEQLGTDCTRALYETIRDQLSHRLPYEDYARAHALGIALDEADAGLHQWCPRRAEWGNQTVGREVRGAMTIVPDLDPPLAHTVARAIERAARSDLVFVDEQPRFAGYSWYDGLPVVRDVQIRIEADGAEQLHHDLDPALVEHGLVDNLIVELFVGPGDTFVLRYPTDMAILDNSEFWSGLDAGVVLVTRGSDIEVYGLVELMKAALFSPSDDFDSDSWQTQSDDFEREALQLARTLLQGEEAAIIGRAVDRVDDHIRWLVPEGRTLMIEVSRDDVAAAFQDATALFDLAAGIGRILHEVESNPAGYRDALGAIRALCAQQVAPPQQTVSVG